MHAAIEQYRAHPSSQSPVPMQVQLLEYVEDLASMLGVRPRIFRHPSAAPRWFLGPFEASHYRLDEPQQSQGGTLEGSTGEHRAEQIRD